jgi:S1-C subfamily serine protease
VITSDAAEHDDGTTLGPNSPRIESAYIDRVIDQIASCRGIGRFAVQLRCHRATLQTNALPTHSGRAARARCPRSLCAPLPVFSLGVGVDDGDREQEDEFGSPLPPEDRIWRHPSEIRSFPTREPVPPAALGDEHPHRSWGMATAGGIVGALSVSLIWFIFGTSNDSPRLVTERVAVSPLDSTPPRFVVAEDWAAEVAAEAWASLVRVDGTDDALSGIVLRDDGIVVTSATNLDDGQDWSSRYSSGDHADLSLIGVDTVTETAVLRSDSDEGEPALMASATPQIGDEVIVVASMSDDAYVQGAAVAGLDQTVPIDGAVLHELMSVNIGDVPNGAAVLDASGSVIAIANGYGDAFVSYATPIEVIRRTAGELIENGWVRHDAYIGVEVEGVTNADGSPTGVEVVSVVETSPADRVGLVHGDHILEISGQPLSTATAFDDLLSRMEPGDWFTVVYRHQDVVHEARAQLAAQPTGSDAS